MIRTVLGWGGGLLGAKPFPSQPEAAVSYQGRALTVLAPLTALRPTPLCDSGELPAAGGALCDALPDGWSDPFVRASGMAAFARGARRRVECFATLSNVTLLPGHPAEVRAEIVWTQLEANGGGAHGTVMIVGLAFGGLPILVTGRPHQTVVLPEIGTLVICEQETTADGNAIVLNALHLHLPDGKEAILCSVRSGLHCVADHSSTPRSWLKALNGRNGSRARAGLFGAGDTRTEEGTDLGRHHTRVIAQSR